MGFRVERCGVEGKGTHTFFNDQGAAMHFSSHSNGISFFTTAHV